jgi:colanic acid biosynthesis glycosyl transferase WcaI
MKVLLLNQTFYPDSVATAQQLTDLALFLREKGYEVTALADRRGYDRRDIRFKAREEYQGIQIHRVPTTGFGRVTMLRRIIDAVVFDFMVVLKLLFMPRHDLVISYTSPPLIGLFGTLFCMLKGGRSVQWLMDVNPDAAIEVGYLEKGSLKARFFTYLLDFTLHHSQHIVVLDRWMKKRAIGHGVLASKISIVPPWPPHAPEKSPDMPFDENPFRKEHGLQGKFVILYSGNHSIVHPLDTLLQGAKRFHNDPDVVFLFIGSGLRVEDVAAFKKKHELNNIVQLPHQPRKVLPYSLASANAHVVVLGNAVNGLVHTSKVYGILATGKPYLVISPKECHLVDLLAECPGGLHVEHGDVDGLVKAIQTLRGYNAKQLSDINHLNQNFIRTRAGSHASMEVFLREVVEFSSSMEKLSASL